MTKPLLTPTGEFRPPKYGEWYMSSFGVMRASGDRYDFCWSILRPVTAEDIAAAGLTATAPTPASPPSLDPYQGVASFCRGVLHDYPFTPVRGLRAAPDSPAGCRALIAMAAAIGASMSILKSATVYDYFITDPLYPERAVALLELLAEH